MNTVTQDPVEQRVIAACDTIRTYHRKRPHDVARFVAEQLGDTGIEIQSASTRDIKDQLETANGEIDELEDEISELKNSLHQAQRERDTLDNQLHAANEEIRNLKHQLDLLRTEGGTIASEED